MSKLKTAKIISIYLAALFALSFFLCSCSTVKKDEDAGCYAAKRYVGYGGGGYAHTTKVSKRKNY